MEYFLFSPIQEGRIRPRLCCHFVEKPAPWSCESKKKNKLGEIYKHIEIVQGITEAILDDTDIIIKVLGGLLDFMNHNMSMLTYSKV